jgi:hypothetical protein
MRRLRSARIRSVLRLPRCADPAGAAALCSMRLPRRLAGEALRRVQRPEDRVRERAGGDRLRRAGASIRAGLEGPRAAEACAGGGGDHRRDALSTSRTGARVRSRRRRALPTPRPPAGRGARPRARPRLGAAGRTAGSACPFGRAPARTRIAGAPEERSRSVCFGTRVAGARLPGRRRLHERRHRRRGGVGAQTGRRSQSGGGHARTRGPLRQRRVGPSRPRWVNLEGTTGRRRRDATRGQRPKR